MQGQTGFPSCSAYDAATGILFIASRGSGSEGAPFVTLWQLDSRMKPALLAQHGRPAKQSWMKPARKETPLWSACIDGTSRTALVAAAGQSLHIFTWQVGHLCRVTSCVYRFGIGLLQMSWNKGCCAFT
jgi:hypothetical protein